jgi:predicted NAD/FAD-dependent oxidoreductase
MTRQALLTDIAPEARICIVGAGASGLTMAHYLAEAGYENVTLFEKRQRVGGKCDSIVVDDQVYEMGAVFGAPNYEVIGDLASRVGLEERGCTPSHFYTQRGRRTALFPRHRFPFLLWQLFAKLAWLSASKYRDIYQPGLADIHPDLYENFETFSDRHGLTELPALFQPIATGFGYGYAEQVPAAYMLKYLSWPMILDCARNKGYVWPEGIQTLWERLSHEHDVLLGADIKQVVRDENIVVSTSKQHFDLDYLILACPLDNALSFLDATAEEHDLFTRIRSYDYWVILCEIDGLPQDIGFIRANFAAENQGHLMLWYSRCPQTKLYTIYILGDFQTSQDVIEANCAADLQRLGARLGKVRAVRRWRYFPHVRTGDMAHGFYEKLEAMQGQRRTFYAGEIMSFSTLECSARYARQLVKRFFQPTPTLSRDSTIASNQRESDFAATN